MLYQESMKVNPIGLTVSYGVCLILALFLGYLYSSITIFMPIVYVNLLLTLGFGLTLGIVNRFLVRLTHNRNKKSQLIQALISGVLANYFQWTAYILYAFNKEVPSLPEFFANLHWVVIPQHFIQAITEINRVGVWSMFGVVFNGFVLTAIWVIEAFIIIALPVTAVYKTKIYPYSELLGQWYPKYTLFKDFEYLSTTNKLQKDLQVDAISAIQGLGKGIGHRHSKIHLFYHKDEVNQYLTFETRLIEGKGKVNSSVLINNFTIDRKTAELILDSFEHQKEKVEII